MSAYLLCSSNHLFACFTDRAHANRLLNLILPALPSLKPTQLSPFLRHTICPQLQICAAREKPLVGLPSIPTMVSYD
eukprot:1158602-Pelagomonas_calceolata.AAC.3